MQERLQNINVLSSELLPTPEAIKRDLPLPQAAEDFVYSSRQAVRRILDREDPRLFVVVGPCSIHDPQAAREYAERLRVLAQQVDQTLLLVMRVYFEKPRTTVGWKGLVNDPDMDDSFHIEKGIRIARELLLHLAAIGIPAATEALDPIMPQYLSELITWTAIGARTTESQTHREMASGLSTPVGFKNGTDGSLTVAINALQSVRAAAPFPGHHAAGPVGRVPHPRQHVRPHRAARRRLPHQLRLGAALRCASVSSRRQGCRPTSWSTAATAIRTRIRGCSRWSRKISRIRFSRATVRWSASCSRAT